MFGTTILLGVLLLPAAGDAESAYPNAADEFSCRFRQGQGGDDQDFDGWPDAWRRQQGPGFPGYVKMAIEPVKTPVGNSAFVIHANGSSAAVETQSLPVDSLHAYVVEALVKTEHLKRDRIRVTLDFVGEEGKSLQSFSTPAQRTQGRWRRVRIGPVHVSDMNASDAVIRLEFLSNPPGDLKGGASFAEVRLLRMPRLELKFNRPEQIFLEGDAISARVHASGVSIQDANVEFTLEDPISKRLFRGETDFRVPADGDFSGDDSVSAMGRFSGPEAAWQIGSAKWELPTKEAGFYRLTAVLRSKRGVEQETRTTLAIVQPALVPAEGRFGWTLPGHDTPLPPAAMRRLVLRSGLHFVKVPIWFSEESRFTKMGPLLDFCEYLRTSGVETVGMFSDPPAEVRKRLKGTGRISAASVFLAEPSIWYGSIENTLLYFGTRADYWQLGAEQSLELCAARNLDKQLEAVRGRISGFAKHARLGIAWSWMAEFPADGSSRPVDFVSLSADPPFTGETLLEALDVKQSDAEADAPERWLAIEPIDATTYSTKTRAADLILRMTAAHRGNAKRVFVATPFSDEVGLMNDDGTPGVLYLPWRTTALELAGAKELGRLGIARDVRNLLFQKGEKTVLVAWSGQPVETPLLTEEELVRVDAWGRREPVPMEGDRRVLRTDRVPAFFLGMDPQAAKMRLSFALDKDRLPSIPLKRFVIGFRFKNAFAPQAAGKIELKGPPGWKIEDAERAFNLGAGDVFAGRFALTLPLQIVGDVHDVRAEITLTAPTRRKFEIRRSIRVGDDGQRFLLCGVLSDDGTLDVFQSTRNDLPRPARFDCQLYAPGRRRVSASVTCGPFAETTTVYRFENGRELLGEPIFLRAQREKDPQVFMRRLIVTE